MLTVRDKFIAHLDDPLTAVLPKLDKATESVKFPLRYLL
jgi:hypothetical protein